MSEALYRKYRSKNLDEVVGQEHVTTTLKNAIKAGKISHAYLLTGPRGTGKTSIARILAHEVNNLPYSTNQHLDIIEIDAASNRRIDEVRDIREKVRIAPTSAKYKVYIIDEVHMLTKEAFNALLKTLEEPPEHAIFILATTEVHKLPETIISRTQRYNLKPINQEVIEKQLKDIADKEKIKVSTEALELIARHSQGGMRDAESMLDQLSSKTDKIELSDVEHMLGVAPDNAIQELFVHINSGNPKQLIHYINDLEEKGVHAPQIAHQLSDYIHHELIEGHIDSTQALGLLENLINVPSAANPTKSLELTLLDYLLSNNPIEKQTETKPKPWLEPKEVEESVVQTPAQPIESQDFVSDENWQAILQAVKQQHNTLYSVVRMAHPKVEDNKLVLSFSFPFHQKRMDEPKNKQLITDIIKQTTGNNIEIICITEVSNQPNQRTEVPSSSNAKTDSDTLDTITDIFGGGEILES